jgi:MioC protein
VIQIIVGTETGTAEYVAEELQGLFAEHQLPSEVNTEIDPSNLSTEQTWLICTSTHGAGEVPNNLANFKQYLETTSDDLSNLKFAVIGLGDSSYDTYCYAANYFSDALKDRGATEIIAVIKADAQSEEMPEDLIIEALTPLIDNFK